MGSYNFVNTGYGDVRFPETKSCPKASYRDKIAFDMLKNN